MDATPITAIGEVATTSLSVTGTNLAQVALRPVHSASFLGLGRSRGLSGQRVPVPKSYVQALERNVPSLELFIQQLATADDSRRDEMLAGYVPKPGKSAEIILTASSPEASTEQELVLARARTGQMRKLRAGKASQLFGGTSLFQIHVGDGSPAVVVTDEGDAVPDTSFPPTGDSDAGGATPGPFPYSPHDELSQKCSDDHILQRTILVPHVCVSRVLSPGYDIGAGPSEPQIDREILRRVYWAAFNADKQLSLYFGRPPALYPHESDVRNTIRIPYPEGWQGLLETYMAKGISATAYEDGIILAGSFIYRVELYKIVHTVITDLFENRRHNADSVVLAAAAQRIHVSLNKWLATLPGKLYWNQWSNGQVQPFVLHLHMVFHTAMIILHRPPRHLLSKPVMATRENVEICYESLQAILRLLRSYSRFYKYSHLPLDFVHTLSVAAGTILMKHFLEDAPASDTGISKSMDTILGAMDDIKYTWPCIVEIRESLVRTMETTKNLGQEEPAGHNPVLDFGFLVDFEGGANAATVGMDGVDVQIADADLGFVVD